MFNARDSSGPNLIKVGDRLGKYELVTKLATGGMAELYLACAAGIEGFEKLAVLKRILPHHANNSDFVRMFLDEARLAATLNHANIAHVFDIGVVGGHYFFTMEYIHGEDVRRMLKALRAASRGLPLMHTVHIVTSVCSALHYAHEKVSPTGEALGIVHRDVSPQNVLVSYDGHVKLVDFGIAKAALRHTDSRSGSLKGKVAYMSPEQCRGDRLDRRSDLFSVGILLYELTTGLRLFPGENEFMILNKIVHEKIVPPSKRRQKYPEALEAIVMKALQKEAADRYQTAQELQEDLEAFATERKVRSSSVALAKFMEELFGKKIDAWRAAQAAGKTLGQHLATLSEVARTSMGMTLSPEVSAPPPLEPPVEKTSESVPPAPTPAETHVPSAPQAEPSAVHRRVTRAPGKKRDLGVWIMLLGLIAALVAGGIYLYAGSSPSEDTPESAAEPSTDVDVENVGAPSSASQQRPSTTESIPPPVTAEPPREP